MAKLCSYCGVALERDDARFCQNCGKSTSPHSLSPTVSVDPASSVASLEVEQPEQFEDTLHVPVVKKSRKNQHSLPEQIAQQPRPNRPATQARGAKLQEQERPALREQVAVQPPASPVPSSHSKTSEVAGESKETLVSDSKLGSDESEPAIPESGKIEQDRTPSYPEPMTDVSVAEQPAREEETSGSAASAMSFTAPPPRTEPPAQEFHAAIADQHATESSAPSAAAQITPISAIPLSLDELPSTPPLPVSQEPEIYDLEEDALEDRPTLLLESHSAEALASHQTAAEETKKDHADNGDEQSARPVIAQPIPAKFSAFPDDVSKLASPLPPVAQPDQSDQPIPARFSSFPDAIRRFTSPLPALAQSIPAKLSGLPAAMRGLSSPLPVIAQSIPAKFSSLPSAMRGLTSSVPALPHTRQRLPVTLVAAVLVALVLIGVGSWLVIAQPFSVPPVTQPLLGFSDAHLGLSLLYPNGWTSKKDASDSTVQFYDSSHTAQVIIAISNVNTSTITADLQKQTAQLGMSGAKSVASLSFAGASWQAMQGTVQQGGASYTCTIFATTHANHLVILTQLAPQSVYNQEESVVFSALRQSLRFF